MAERKQEDSDTFVVASLLVLVIEHNARLDDCKKQQGQSLFWVPRPVAFPSYLSPNNAGHQTEQREYPSCEAERSVCLFSRLRAKNRNAMRRKMKTYPAIAKGGCKHSIVELSS
jgi:hypothetical protein